MNEAMKELERAYEGLPVAARLASAAFAAKVFAMLRTIMAEVESLKKK